MRRIAIGVDEADLKSAVLHQLNKGQARATKGEILAQRLGERNTRGIRLAIEELIRDGFPICSSPHKPYGYFLAETPQDITEALRVLRSYGKMIFLHYRDLKRAGHKAFAGQLSLKI